MVFKNSLLPIQSLLFSALCFTILFSFSSPVYADVNAQMPEGGAQWSQDFDPNLPDDPIEVPTEEPTASPPPSSGGGPVPQAECLIPVRFTYTDMERYNNSSVFSGTASNLSCVQSIANKYNNGYRQLKDNDDDEDAWSRLWGQMDDRINYENGSDRNEWNKWIGHFPDLPGPGHCTDEDDGYECVGMALMDENCQPANPDGNYEVCGYLDAQYIESPISLIWEASGEIREKVSAVTFPLNPYATGSSYYAWRASARTPLVVYDPDHTGVVTSATQLFGRWTFGGKTLASARNTGVAQGPWEHGFEALATLDRDGDGKVSGNELQSIALWFDKNMDGVSQEGEVKKASEVGLLTLFVTPDYVNPGTHDVYAYKGFEKTVNGRTITGTAVDWYSTRHETSEGVFEAEQRLRVPQGLSSKSEALFEQNVFSARVRKDFGGAWLWRADRDYGGARQGGAFTLMQRGSEVRGKALTEVGLEKNSARVKSMMFSLPLRGTTEILKDGRQKLNFEVRGYKGRITKSEAVLSADGKTLAGRSVTPLPKSSSGGAASRHEYTWSATRVQ